jgi:aspartyl protease family protein
MGAGISFAILVGAMGALVLFGDRDSIGGLSPAELAGLAAVIALAIPFLQRVGAAYRGQWSKGMQALAFWLAMIILLVGLHSYRFELSDVANRIIGAFIPGAAITTRSGEVVIARQEGGSFVMNGRVNDASTRFIFDTGATAVVLTHDTARRAGLRITENDYSVPVSTANGRTMAAPARIGELIIGSIRERDVRALVARPEALRENLLGMTFLERLSSYRVESDKLILRGR